MLAVSRYGAELAAAHGTKLVWKTTTTDVWDQDGYNEAVTQAARAAGWQVRCCSDSLSGGKNIIWVVFEASTWYQDMLPVYYLVLSKMPIQTCRDFADSEATHVTCAGAGLPRHHRNSTATGPPIAVAPQDCALLHRGLRASK